MKVLFLMVGKTDFQFINDGFMMYVQRIKRYISFDIGIIRDIKKSKAQDTAQMKKLEGDEILNTIQASDYVVLLDEKGKELTSVSFSSFIENKMNTGAKRLVFVVGGAYGFSEEVYKRANYQLSLSNMTFSHQIIRIIFLEQLYRAFTIIKGEPYHHG